MFRECLIEESEMNILFYTPLNTRSRDIESQAIEFQKKGHAIFLLTQSHQGPLHSNFASYGFNVSAAVISSKFSYVNLIMQLYNFIMHCWLNKIDVVYAHLEPANFIAVIGQFFTKARIIICRHHMDYAKLHRFDNDLSYRITYKLAKNIVVVSRQAKEYMVREEGVAQEKIHHIPLSYNFSLYRQHRDDTVSEIKSRYTADVLLLTVCRLTQFKRPEISIELIRQLKQRGINAKLLILGKGELEEKLQHLIQNGLQENVFLTGYVENVLDYMAAADLLVHPSVSESSCISIKEAGLVRLPVIVAEGVGDFDDIIEHRKNGFRIKSSAFVDQSLDIVRLFITDKEMFKAIGTNLQRTVLDKFDIKGVAEYYEGNFHKSKRKPT